MFAFFSIISFGHFINDFVLKMCVYHKYKHDLRHFEFFEVVYIMTSNDAVIFSVILWSRLLTGYNFMIEDS